MQKLFNALINFKIDIRPFGFYFQSNNDMYVKSTGVEDRSKKIKN